MKDKDLKNYDFIDFGSGKGGCMTFAAKKLGGRNGLGFELHKDRVADLKNRGFNCICSDITKLALPRKCVSFVTMSHFLEHLDGMNKAAHAINLAICAARDFVFIEGPSFDFDEYLKCLGFKFFWFDGCGHRLRITTRDILCVANKTSMLHSATILTERPYVESSASNDVHPLDSPARQIWYDPKQHPKKALIKFDRHKVYRSFIIFLWLKPVDIRRYIHCRAKFESAFSVSNNALSALCSTVR